MSHGFCISAVHYDFEAWVLTEVWDDACMSAVKYIGLAASGGEEFPMLQVERWPQVLDDYRRAGLIT